MRLPQQACRINVCQRRLLDPRLPRPQKIPDLLLKLAYLTDGAAVTIRCAMGEAGRSEQDDLSPRHLVAEVLNNLIDLNEPLVGMAATPSGDGYWLVAADGGVFTFNAVFYGSLPERKITPNKPVVGMAATPSGKGYWLVAGDAGVFTFGDAVFYGSMGGKPLNKPVVGIAATPSGKGYWLIAGDGGVFRYGDAGFYGTMVDKPLNAPIVGMAPTPSGEGYWMVGGDGACSPSATPASTDHLAAPHRRSRSSGSAPQRPARATGSSGATRR